MNKTCIQCGYSGENFHKDQIICKECFRGYLRSWSIGEPDNLGEMQKRERQRVAHLRSKYGIEIEEYNALRDAQGGVCAICGRENILRGKRKLLVVDHDHETLRIRGLLCQDCNIGLGLFQDEPVLLKKALDYLSKSNI